MSGMIRTEDVAKNLTIIADELEKIDLAAEANRYFRKWPHALRQASSVIQEQAARLAALPRIYDVSKGERPERGRVVVAIFIDQSSHSGVEIGNYEPERDSVRTNCLKKGSASRYFLGNVEYWLYADDLAAWIKKVKS